MSDLEELFRRHAKELRRFLRRRVANAELAADLAQEAFYRLLRSRQSGVGEANNAADGRAYLFSIAANLAIDHRRQALRQPQDSDAEGEMAAHPDPRPSAERRALSREEWQILTSAVDGLPPRARQVFLLHKVDELSHAEIAARLGISKNTVIVHMGRALAHCRRVMAQHRGENG